MRINDTIPKLLSVALLGLLGVFFAYFAWLFFGMFLKSLTILPAMGFASAGISITIFVMTCLFVAASSLLLSGAFFEYKRPSSKLIWTAFGLTAGLCIGVFLSEIMRQAGSTLWETDHELMVTRTREIIYTLLIALTFCTVWLALPLWRHRPKRIVAA